MSDRERLIRYVRRYFERHNHEKFPTVREAAKALRMKHSDIEMEAETLPLMLTSWNTTIPEPLSNWFVEVCE